MTDRVLKPIVICLMGPSGSGKSLAASMIAAYFDYYIIQSYTDRPKRQPDELGHIFLTAEEYDNLIEHNIPIARTEFGNYRYCCLQNDIRDKTVYVIDPKAFDHMKSMFGNDYHFISVYIHARPAQILQRIPLNRSKRDDGHFEFSPNYYDYIINNVYNRDELFTQIQWMIRDIEEIYNVSSS